MIRPALVLAITLTVMCAARADDPFGPTPTPFPWTVDGGVQRFVPDGNRLYIVGKFRLAGRPTGPFASLDPATGASIGGPMVNGDLTAIEPDGNGGAYISGNFSRVGGLIRNQFAHVLADGTVGPLVLETQGAAKDILVHNGVVYVAGYSGWGKTGTQRDGLAAFDLATGALLPWDPFPTHFDTPKSGEGFECLAVRGNELWAGGVFDCLFDTTKQRKNFVALDLVTATVSAWNPAPNSTVFDMKDLGNDVVFAGWFTTFDSQARSGIAIVDPVTKSLGSFSATFAGAIYDCEVSGSTLYVGGDIGLVNGTPRKCAAALDLATSQLLPFDPQMTSSVESNGPRVWDLDVVGNDVVLGGAFDHAGAERRWSLARVDGTTGAVTSWRCDVGGPESTHVDQLVLNQGVLMLGGNFNLCEGEERNSLAAIDLVTEELLPLSVSFTKENSPNSLGDLRDVEPFGDTLIVSGQFFDVNGVERRGIAAIDRDTGALVTGFDTTYPGTQKPPWDLRIINGKLWVSEWGDFDDLCAFDPATGVKLDAAINTIETTAVFTLETNADGSTLFFGGNFSDVVLGTPPNITVIPRGRIASMSTSTYQLSGWDPMLNAQVKVLRRVGGSLYACGDFQTSGTNPTWLTRPRICEFNIASSALTPFAPNINNGNLVAMAVSGKWVFVGGSFSQINNQFHKQIAAIDRATGLPSAWKPDVTGVVSTLEVVGDRLFVGLVDGLRQFAGDAQSAMTVFRIDTLTSPTKTISLATGGSQVLNIHAGFEQAGKSFWMLGSASGTSPDFNLAGVRVPLALDAYTMFTLTTPFFVFIGNPGLLDAYGEATTTFVLPARLSPALAGLTVHHAALAYDAGLGVPTFATAPVGVTLTP